MGLRKLSADVVLSSVRRATGVGLLASTVALLPLPALAAEFVAADDSTVLGEIIRFTKSTVTIRPADGSMIMLPPDYIKQVRYSLDNGSTIEGVLRDWYDGIYVLEIQEVLVGARDGALLQGDLPPRPEKPRHEGGDAGAALASEPKAPEKTPLTPPAEETFESDDRIEASLRPDVADDGDEDDLVKIKATADATSEEAKELVFDITSSKPWPQDIIVLYTTLDGTAEAGSDFESTKGIARLPAGTTSIQLVVPLIDDDEAEDDESLTLFLSSALDVATIPERKVVATIRDSD